MEPFLKHPSNHLRDHIETVAKQEQEFLKERTTSERISDSLGAFIGSVTFVSIQFCGSAVWMVVNTRHVGRFSHFDPFPFPFLCTILAIETTLLASFIIMRQRRIGRRVEEREHLIIQMVLLTAKEITAGLRSDR